MRTVLLQLEGVFVLPTFIRAAVRPYADARRAAWLAQHGSEGLSAVEVEAALWTEALSGALTTAPQRDVVRNLRRWRDAGDRVVVLGEPDAVLTRLLFTRTTHNDLSPLIDTVLGGPDGDPLTPAAWTAWSAAHPHLTPVLADPAWADAARAAGLPAVLIDRAARAPGSVASLDDV
jgi:methionine salvage enolase-phosphatase E1